MMKILPETEVVRNPDIRIAPVGEELVMFSVDRGKYYGLNEVGAAVWQGIESPVSVGRLCAGLQDHFDVSPKQCLEDVSRYLEELQAEALIRIVASDRRQEKEDIS
jgi:hypothetical protein